MALRTKTIEYAFGTDTATLALATRRDLAAITLFIPEATSRTFKSVIVEVNVRGDETVAASLTSWLIGIKLGAVAFNDVTTTVTLTNTGDHQSHVFTRDVTDYFNTNFGSGASQTCQVGMSFGALATANHTVKLIITYEYDDAAQSTRVKTVRIPIESPTAQLTATLANIGSSQVPALDTFLPEASKVYRRIWFEFYFNDGGNATTDIQLGVRIDAEAETNIYRSEQALNTGVFGKAHWVKEDFTKNATHNIAARSNATASRFTGLSVVLYVTYEYDHSSSTSIMNSLLLAAADEIGWPGNTTTNDESRFERMIWVEEPGTITLRQSAVLGFINDPGTITLNMQVGSQASSRAYTLTAGSAECGPRPFCHRIDSGGAAGAALTLARGRNVVDIDRWTTAAQVGSNFSAMLILNYTSDKHADGDAVHNQTTCWSICDPNNVFNSVQRDISAPNRLFSISETNYYMTGLIYEVMGVMAGATASAFVLQAERTTGEFEEKGWEELIAAMYRSDGELGVFWTLGAARDQFNRWPGDPRAGLDLETTRQYRMCMATFMTLGVRAWVTRHAITYSVAGTISGSSGGTVNLALCRADSNGVPKETVLTGSRTGNGAYSFTWYDNTEDMVVVARESDTLLGVSAPDVAA